MAKEIFHVIREAGISNNCPECFNQDLTLTFLQKHIHSRMHHRTTSEVQYQINCNKCQSIIYPVKWTEDIEKSFEYYQKTVNPDPSGIRFTALFYGILAGLVILGGVLYYLYSENIIQF